MAKKCMLLLLFTAVYKCLQSPDPSVHLFLTTMTKDDKDMISFFVSTGMDPHICATCTSYECMLPADACPILAQGCDLYRTGKVSEV